MSAKIEMVIVAMNERYKVLRKQIYLTRDLDRRLRDSARRARETESAVVREALEEYLAREERRRTPPGDNPVLQMAGMFEGNPDCCEVSGDTDRHLADPPGNKRG